MVPELVITASQLNGDMQCFKCSIAQELGTCKDNFTIRVDGICRVLAELVLRRKLLCESLKACCSKGMVKR